MPDHFIAFWNVENLFDVAGSPHLSEKLERALAGELKGWTAAVLDRKIAQLASVISSMNGGRGPDLLGVCEIENRRVLELLVAALAPLGRRYEVVQADTSDGRGIDVAFLYDRALFRAEEQFQHVIQKRTATRELFQVNFRTAAGRPLVIIGNHWPARLPGQYETEPFRIVAAETLAYFVERILEVLGSSTPILAMGDFNDNPFDRSLEHVLSTQDREKVTRARNPRLLNLMWPLVGTGLGSYYFDGTANWLDQFLASKALLREADPLRVLPETAAVLHPPPMRTSIRNFAPRRFGRPATRTLDRDGFSDHYPITVTLRERR
jgi:predicted extracellular nuclease